MSMPSDGPEPGPLTTLNSKQLATLAAVFDRPTRSDVLWRDIERLFMALGGEVTQGRGSRVRIALNGRRATFHEPHPDKVTDKGALSSVRDFLRAAGVV